MNQTTRYPWGDFDADIKNKLRARADCVEVARAAGLVGKARLSGRGVKIRCPHPGHDDVNPSCSVRPDGFFCFGCDASGDVFELVGLIEGIDGFPEQVERVAEIVGVDYAGERERFVAHWRDALSRQKPGRARAPASSEVGEGVGAPMGDEEADARARAGVEGAGEGEGSWNPDTLELDAGPIVALKKAHSCPPGAPEPVDPKALRRARSRRAAVYAHLVGGLGLSGAPADYLAGRGIDPGLARALGVRSVDGEGWAEALRGAWRRFGRQALEDAGLLGADEFDRPAPHPGARGEMLVFAYPGLARPSSLRFRMLGASARSRYLSLRGAHNQPRAPFLGDEDGAPALGVSPGGVVYVTEGELNALSLLSCGRAAVGIPGARGFRPEWAAGLAGATCVILLLDGDEASGALSDEVVAACEQVLSPEWTSRHVRAHVMRDAAGEPIDANDALCQGCLGARLENLEALAEMDSGEVAVSAPSPRLQCDIPALKKGARATRKLPDLPSEPTRRRRGQRAGLTVSE
jgi:hypothetical protein